MHRGIGALLVSAGNAGILLSPSLLACGRPTADNEPPPAVVTRWYAPQDGRSVTRPAIVDNVVVFGTGDGTLIAREVETGRAKWSTHLVLSGGIEGANIVVQGDVIAASGSYAVGAVSRTDGGSLWTFVPPPDTTDAEGSVAPGYLGRTHLGHDEMRIYVAAWGASVSAVDLQTGGVAWLWRMGRVESDTAASIFRSGAGGTVVDDFAVYTPVWHFRERRGLTSDVWLLALDRENGAERWRVPIPKIMSGAAVFGAPVLYGDLVIFGTVDGSVWAVDRNSHEIVWQFETHPKYFTLSQFALFDGTIYIDGRDDWLYAVRAVDGGLLWRVHTGNGSSADLLVTDCCIYFPIGGVLRIFARATGDTLTATAVRRLGDAFESPGVGSGGAVFMNTTPAAISFIEP